MRTLGLNFVLLAAIPALFSGCSAGPNFVAKYEPWREQEEAACLQSGVLARAEFLRTRSALGGPSVCGTEHPFEMAAADDGRVALEPVALLRCPMIPQVDHWIRNTVVPASLTSFGQPVVKVKVAASYSCRPKNNVGGATLSEHGYANAIDISGFVLQDGRTVTVQRGWLGAPEEQRFLRLVHQGGCQNFMTVLGPDHDSHHRDHFHLDLARHGSEGLKRICK